jgi:hypothetical protein
LGNPANLEAFEKEVGKGISIWNWFQLWNRPDNSENMEEFDAALMTECRDAGSIPMISWAPESGDPNDQFTNLESILDGSQDAYLTAWGEASAAWGHPYFIRLFWEFTGSWTDGIYPFGDGNTGAAEFVQAWQYVVNKVRAAGGTDISWVWCPANVGDSVSTLQSLYPGDSYVDWVGTDVYPRSGQSFSSASQTEIKNIEVVAPDKPMMLPELGYPTGSNSGSWWNNMLNNVLPNNYPFIQAVCIWQDPSEDASWNVIDSNTLSGFQAGITSSYYSSNVYSSLNISPITALGENPNSNPTPTSQPTSTPTYIGGLTPTPSPTSTSKSSPVVSSGLGWSDVVIIVVIAAMAGVAVVAVAPKISLRRKRLKEVDEGRAANHAK